MHIKSFTWKLRPSSNYSIQDNLRSRTLFIQSEITYSHSLESTHFFGILIFFNIKFRVFNRINDPWTVLDNVPEVMFHNRFFINDFTFWVDVLQEAFRMRRWIFRFEQLVVNPSFSNSQWRIIF